MAVNLKIVSQVVASGTPGPAGKSAYQIAVDNGFEGTESEWLKELHPFKGWFDSVSELEEEHPAPSVGEYAYVKGATSSDPVKIYECSTEGAWSDSGRTVDTSTVQTFRSGEAVNDVGIDAEPTAGSDNLVKSGGVAGNIESVNQESIDAALLLNLNGTYSTGNLRSQVVLNRAISTNGEIAVNFDRSLLKIPVYDYRTLIVLSGISLIRYAFCSENPDLHSSQAVGFISATTSDVQPTSIPQNAKWIIYDISTALIAESIIATYTNTELNKKVNEKTKNPILKNHTYEIRYRGTAQLCWDDTAKKLYWTDGTSGDNDGSMIHLNIVDKVVKIGIGGVTEKTFSTTGNTQLLLPLPSGIEPPVYTLNDIVVLSGGTYDETAYVKIAHITWGNAISSFICKKEVKDNVVTGLKNGLNSVKIDIAHNSLGIEYNSLDIASLTPNFDYSQILLVNKNIDTTGILQDYSGRYAVFFKMPKKGTAPTIVSDVAPAVYQWYSGKPDYITGSNSLGRTTGNTPPENAEYGGLTFLNSQPTTILITNNEEIKELKNTIGILGSNLNNSVGENNFANGLRTNLKILGYGNSFMRNSVAYLSAVANGCGVNLVVGNLYTGGTELHNHLAALRNNSAEYEWHKYENGVETQSQGTQTPMRGLLEERWDAIIVHQYIPWQFPFEPTLNQFLKLIIERLGYTPKIYINATWAGSLDENQTYYGYETEKEMWEAMLNYVKGACEDSGVQEFSIIPTGTAIQNARTLSWADSYNRFVNNSPDLHHLNPAGGFIAACTLYQKIVAPLNGIACSQTTFRITSETAMPPDNNVQSGILVTDSNYAALCKCAIDAVNNPFVITQQ